MMLDDRWFRARSDSALKVDPVGGNAVTGLVPAMGMGVRSCDRLERGASG
jgi:hypothetical protein